MSAVLVAGVPTHAGRMRAGAQTINSNRSLGWKPGSGLAIWSACGSAVTRDMKTGAAAAV